VQPFDALALGFSPPLVQALARRHATAAVASATGLLAANELPLPMRHRPKAAGKRLHVGYLSSG
jgi:hypothetical protein